MSYRVSTIPLVDKQAKRLAKKFPSLKKDLARLIEILIDEPFNGTSLGNNFFKIRLAIESKGRGKSGGARLVTYIKVASNTVYLVSIFDTTEKSTITDKELIRIFKMIQYIMVND